jgi:GT2 family glycosyltransferase
MKIAAVVVTYNRKNLLKENIDHLLHQTKNDVLDILVIDNHSTDGTKQFISSYLGNPRVIYKDTGANLGGAGGFQYGIRYAAEHSYDYIWVMDDDCMPTESALEEFLAADERLKGDYGFLSSKVLWKDHSICVMNKQRKTLTKNVDDFESDLVPVVMASFVSMFIPVKRVYEMGLPIKEFFIWTDDWEFTRRISRQYSCYLCNKSIVIHKSNSNIGANIATDVVERLDRFNYLYRNDVFLYRREGAVGFFYEAARLIAHVLRVLLKAKDNRMKRLQCIIAGTARGLAFHPAIEFPNKTADQHRENKP